MTNTIPLLPPLVKRAKDAACAVRQGVHILIHQVTEATLTHLLDLPGFKVSGYVAERQPETDILHLFCELTKAVVICPRCRSASTTIKQYQERCVRDLDVWSKRTFLHFAIRRFECPDCGHRLRSNCRQSIGIADKPVDLNEKSTNPAVLQSSKKAVAERFSLSQ